MPADELMIVHTPHNWPACRFEARRASRCRWVWIGAAWAGDQVGKARAYITDDHGNLVETHNQFNESMHPWKDTL